MFVRGCYIESLVNVNNFDIIDLIPSEDKKHMIIAKKGSLTITLAMYDEIEKAMRDFERLINAISKEENIFEFQEI